MAMVSPEGQWWRCDCQARLRKSVPFLSPGCSLRGRHSGRIRLLWGCAPRLLGKRGLPGTGRWGSHTRSPGPQPPMAAALPRGTATTCAARSSARRRPARASRPSALPAVTRAPNGVLLHPVLQQHRGRAHGGAPAGRVPPGPGRRGGCSSAACQLWPLTVNPAFFYTRYHQDVVYSQEGSWAEACS